MTKRQYRESTRLLPVGKEGIERIRQVLKKGQFSKVNEVAVDAFSASVIVAVYDAVNDENKTKLEGMCIGRLADVCMKTYSKSRAG